MIREILLCTFPVTQIVMVQKYPQGGSVWTQRPATLSAYFTNSQWQSTTHKKRRQKQQKYANEKQEVNWAGIADYQYLKHFLQTHHKSHILKMMLECVIHTMTDFVQGHRANHLPFFADLPLRQLSQWQLKIWENLYNCVNVNHDTVQ